MVLLVFCLFHCSGVDVFIQTRSCEQDVRPGLKIRLKDGGGEAEQREHEELHPGKSCGHIFQIFCSLLQTVLQKFRFGPLE